MDVVQMDPGKLVPYKRNTKKHSEQQIENVAASIKRFGFVQPVVVDKDNVIVIGHSRTLAAKKLGLKSIPVVVADTLSEEEVRALRIADNKLNESVWDADNLEMELENISWAEFDLDFDFTGDTRRKKSWERVVRRCNLKKQIRFYENGSYTYTCFYAAGDKGKPLEEIKADRENVRLFADNLEEWISRMFGQLGKSWCVMTTPMRRHKDFHFATEICRLAAAEMGVAFYEGAAEIVNRGRVAPTFIKTVEPAEDNILLYDDILTTGETIDTMRSLFIGNHVVFPVVAIRNKK